MDESQFHAILLRNIREGVIATDLEGKITYWNQGASVIFGYSADEMIGSTPARLYPGQDESTFLRELSKIDTGVDYTGEWQGRRKDGSEVCVDITTTVICCNSTGNAIGYVGISRDVTERKRLEQQIARLLTREQLAHSQLRRFLAVIAHEIRQPLTIMQGSIQGLQRQAEQQNANRMGSYLRLLDEASTRLQRFIEDVQDAAKIGISQFIVQPAEMDLVSTLRLVVAEQEQNSNHRLVLDTPGELWGTWDRDRVIQLFTNLVANAMKYSPSGSEVRIIVECCNDSARVHVSDHGPGIHSDHQAELFQPFTRGDDNTRGTGLGLYICRGIIDAHGGRIWVESELGKGSDFVVELPLSAPSTKSA